MCYAIFRMLFEGQGQPDLHSSSVTGDHTQVCVKTIYYYLGVLAEKWNV
jgi:hypothetical protein